jgi:hypothetical protein
VKVLVDSYQAATALVCQSTLDQNSIVLPAKTILVATGAKPNIAYAFEHKDVLEREGLQYKRFEQIDKKFEEISQENHVKSNQLGMFTSYHRDDKRVSFLGDTHPTFHGSVVKAIASAKKAFESIDQLFDKKNSDKCYEFFSNQLNRQFNTYVVSKHYLNNEVLELTVHAPEAALHYQPGVIYKLQTYAGDYPSSESIAAGAIEVIENPNQLKFLIKIRGTSTQLLSDLHEGDRLVVMGPTGVRTTIVENQSVIVIGGFLAWVQLQSLLPALKAKGNAVYFFGCFKQELQGFSQEFVQKQCDGYLISIAQDFFDHVEALKKFISTIDAQSPENNHSLQMRIVGDDQLLSWIKLQRKLWLDHALPKQTTWVGSVYGPMQCMLKGVCAQCLQWQIDPTTGQRTKAVYACSWQDQPFEKIDMMNIQERLSQNHMQETLHQLWFTQVRAFAKENP